MHACHEKSSKTIYFTEAGPRDYRAGCNREVACLQRSHEWTGTCCVLTVKAEDVFLPILDLHCVDCWEVVEPDETQGEVLAVNQHWRGQEWGGECR